MAQANLGSEVRVYVDCPSTRFPHDVPKPKIELFAFKLAFCDGQPTEEQKNTAILFAVDDELPQAVMHQRYALQCCPYQLCR